jgi:uncharacterized protein
MGRLPNRWRPLRADMEAMPLEVLIKPTGAVCNLDCTYCFYLEKEKLYPNSGFHMSEQLLARTLRQLVEAHPGQLVTVGFSGGEPTLAGIDFFRRLLTEEAKYPVVQFENTLQTNGTLVNDEWGRLLREGHFQVGLALDGPAALHDRMRVDKGGRPTFAAVMRGLDVLVKHNVERHFLTAVHRHNGDHGLKVYRFLRDQAGAEFIRFTPVVERSQLMPLGRGRVAAVSEQSVRPEQLGCFLIEIFDEWLAHDVGRVSVQTFEAALANWLRLPSSGMCVFDSTCGHSLVLEHNGDVYSCDHFVEPEHRLGNLDEKRLAQLARSQQQGKFGLDKLATLPRVCRSCDVRFACHGDCPKHRFTVARDGEPGLSYLCDAYLRFFRHIDAPMQRLTQLLRSGRPAAEVMQA